MEDILGCLCCANANWTEWVSYGENEWDIYPAGMRAGGGEELMYNLN